MSARFGQNPSSHDVRRSFLEFFQSKDHTIVPSSSLLPPNDPTLLFNAAGMVQFKDVFTGKESRDYTRATSSQKCIRISGKHNDLENVGVTARHHTFFEMLGNFSFGDYFKKEAIAYAWELLTEVWQIPKEKLVITVFGGEKGLAADDEARAIWREVTGFGDERIIGMGMDDNFWSAGDTGPCGPCTEIHYFHGDNVDVSSFGQEPTPDGLGWMEIWNLVFMQYERSNQNGELVMSNLPKPCVDTGAGLERVTAVLQGKTSNYDTDGLRALVDEASIISGKPYNGSQGDDDVSMRVIADHARTTAFLIAEGVFPDRTTREYVLRRVMRRAVRHGHRLGITKPFLHQVALRAVELMGDVYPELTRRKELIASVTEQEEVRFRETIDRGLRMLDDEIAQMRTSGATTIPGEAAFRLYDTFGFPLDLTEVIAHERGLTVDGAGYDKALVLQQKKSQGGKLGEEAVSGVHREALATVAAGGVTFLGYENERARAVLKAILKSGALVAEAHAGDDVELIFDRTPFYGESGGQVGDAGEISVAGKDGAGEGAAKARISDTRKPLTGLVVHSARISEGTLKVGQEAELVVDHALRTATRRNHSATHLLHWALRTVLGEQSVQKGSLVGPDRLRFDFSHGRPVTPEELLRIEDLVNAKVLENAPVLTEVLPVDVARAKGAIAIFEEKYGDVVRVLTMTADSVELCGGTHARATGDIGLFTILSEAGVAAGVRRIEAATGTNAIAHVRALAKTLHQASRALKSTPEDMPEKLERLVERERALDKEVTDLKRKVALGGSGAGGGVDALLASARQVGDIKVLAGRIDGLDAAMHRETAEKLRDKLGQSAVLLASVNGPKVSLVVAVTKEASARYKAGDLIKPIAAMVGGSGGGRPDMAQAGGTELGQLDAALARFYELVTA